MGWFPQVGMVRRDDAGRKRALLKRGRLPICVVLVAAALTSIGPSGCKQSAMPSREALADVCFDLGTEAAAYRALQRTADEARDRDARVDYATRAANDERRYGTLTCDQFSPVPMSAWPGEQLARRQ